LKRLNFDLISNKSHQDRAISEFTFGNSFKHTNLIEYYQKFHYGSNIAFLIEYGDLGSLDNFLKNKTYKNYKPAQNIKIDKFWHFANDILSGLKYMHDNKYLHLDIKTSEYFHQKCYTKRSESQKDWLYFQNSRLWFHLEC